MKLNNRYKIDGETDLTIETLIDILLNKTRFILTIIVFSIFVSFLFNKFIRPPYFETTLRIQNHGISHTLNKKQASEIVGNLFSSQDFKTLLSSEIRSALASKEPDFDKQWPNLQEALRVNQTDFKGNMEAVIEYTIKGLEDSSKEPLFFSSSPNAISVRLDGARNEWIFYARTTNKGDLREFLILIKSGLEKAIDKYNLKLSEKFAKEKMNHIEKMHLNLKTIIPELKLMDELKKEINKSIKTSNSLDQSSVKSLLENETNLQVHKQVMEIYEQLIKSKILTDEIELLSFDSSGSTFIFVPQMKEDNYTSIEYLKINNLNFFLAIGLFLGFSLGILLSFFLEIKKIRRTA